jgi:hypothetical protein
MRQRSRDLILLLTVVVAFCCAATAQTGQPQSDQPTGSDQPARKGRGSRGPSPTANLPFDAHDFSGVWMGRGPFNTLSGTPPPMTAWAKARYDAAKPGIGPRAQPLGNDPIMGCDPIGYPRIAFYNAYPMEFVQTKDRLIELFDFFYVHRTIYLDGRPLPADPEPTWYGYSVGRWEGNTLVVESNGFNDESWLDNDGHPHSEEMTLEERFQRVDHDTIEARMTLTDPKAYTAPWVSDVTRWTLSPNQKMREDICAPSDEQKYRDEMRVPAAGKK